MNKTDRIVNELNDLLQELQGDIDFAVESVEHASRHGCFELSNDIINDLVSMVSVMIRSSIARLILLLSMRASSWGLQPHT